jgi:hypothetical protein
MFEISRLVYTAAEKAKLENVHFPALRHSRGFLSGWPTKDMAFG